MSTPQRSETMVGRMGESGARFWVLLGGNRWAVTAGLAVGLFVSLIVLGTVGPSSFRSVMSSTNQVGIAFQAFIASLITGVTLVVSIGQLVLSQELGALDEQRERMKGVIAFRRDVHALSGSIGPADPPALLRGLVRTSSDRAEALGTAVAENGDSGLGEQVDLFVTDLVRNGSVVQEQLGGTRFGEFGLLHAAMDYNHSWKLYTALRLQSEHEDSLSDEEYAAFDELIEVLMLFGAAREHFKAIYFQWELVHLIRSILTSAVPALTVAIATLLYLAPDSLPGTTLGVANIIWAVSASATLAVVPFFVLASTVLRVATVAKRTSAVGPFVLHESDRADDVELEA